MPIIISDSQVVRDFVQKVEEISGEKFSKCMQCGTCSGICPMGAEMQLSPRHTVLMTKFGQKDRLLDSNTVWLCASCHSCLVRCPRGLDLPKVMEAIRQITLRTNENYLEPFEIPDELLEDLPPIAMVSCFRKHTA
ncbi:4Fe-4S dicluster domain-containing protein [bacterium]|nr:4Fe-4S dicluster domain-containing protein [bacterium]MBU1652234.1 4Fe-4S dicluster domain-containing protein [bacterium]MBU1882074.1 4Fe-4S dicluster domain-containing protein [bacterium]